MLGGDSTSRGARQDVVEGRDLDFLVGVPSPAAWEAAAPRLRRRLEVPAVEDTPRVEEATGSGALLHD